MLALLFVSSRVEKNKMLSQAQDFLRVFITSFLRLPLSEIAQI